MGTVKHRVVSKATQEKLAARAFERAEEERIRTEREARPNPVKDADKARRRAIAKQRAAEKKEKEAQALAEEMTKPGYVAPKRGRPFGAVGGYFKPWMKRIIGQMYTDTMLVRDFILLGPEKRVQLLQDLDPKTFGEGSPEEVAAKIKAALDAIQKSVPAPTVPKKK